MRHHILSRGAGGSDDPDNIIHLCFECHRKVHDGVLNINESIKQPNVSTEGLVDFAIQIRDCEWELAKICYFLTARGFDVSSLSYILKKSKRHINDLIRTFQAFPFEESRIPELSFTHHKIAARAKNPHEMLNLAYEKRLSTRELSKLVDDEDVWRYRCDKLLSELKKLLNSPYRDYLVTQISNILEENHEKVSLWCGS